MPTHDHAPIDHASPVRQALSGGARVSTRKGRLGTGKLFAAGIAAHAMLEAIIDESIKVERELARDEAGKVCERVGRVLVSEGRSFDGVPEAPLAPSRVAEGRDIVMAYLAREGALPGWIGVDVEAGLAIDEHGQPCMYGSGASRYQGILDALELADVVDDDGEAWGQKYVIVWEYKTAWSTSAAELDTLQTRGHAVLVYAHHPEVAMIQRNVVNLRTGAVYTDEMQLDDLGLEKLRQWRSDIFAACDAADRTREARPGAGCDECPWVLRCADADLVVSEGPDGRDETVLEIARRYAVTEAIAKALAGTLRKLCDTSQISIEGGAVGYQERVTRRPIEGSASELGTGVVRCRPGDER